jgi:hypothetical protein
MSTMSVQSVKTALARKREDGIEIEHLVARAERIHQFLIENEPHILALPLEDQTRVCEILKETLHHIEKHSDCILVCRVAQITPQDYAMAEVQNIVGGISPDFADFNERFVAADRYTAGLEAESGEQLNLMCKLVKEWDNDVESQNESDLLYQSKIDDCIEKLKKVHQQLQENISMNKRSYCCIC